MRKFTVELTFINKTVTVAHHALNPRDALKKAVADVERTDREDVTGMKVISID